MSLPDGAPGVFATVGNANQDFHRLVEAVDELASVGAIDPESSFIQTGRTAHAPIRCAWASVLTPDEFRARLRAADVVVCHGGAGTLIQVLDSGRVPVVMPRRRRYGEHVDDHQVELVSVLAERGRVVVAWEPRELADAIRVARMRDVVPPDRATRLVSHLGASIRELLGGAEIVAAERLTSSSTGS